MKKIIYILSKRGNKLIILSIILIILGIKLCIAESCDNGFEVLIGRVISVSFFIGAIVAFMSGKGINSSEAKRIEKEEREKKKGEQERASMREEIKQEILNELKNKKEKSPIN